MLLRPAFCANGRKGDSGKHSAQLQRWSLSDTWRAAASRGDYPAARERDLDQTGKEEASDLRPGHHGIFMTCVFLFLKYIDGFPNPLVRKGRVMTSVFIIQPFLVLIIITTANHCLNIGAIQEGTATPCATIYLFVSTTLCCLFACSKHSFIVQYEP